MRSATVVLISLSAALCALVAEASLIPTAENLEGKQETQAEVTVYSYHYTASLTGETVFCRSIQSGSGSGEALGTFKSGTFNLHTESRCADPTATDRKCRFRWTDRIKGKFIFDSNGHRGSIRARSGWRRRSSVQSTVFTHLTESVTIKDETSGQEFTGYFAFKCIYRSEPFTSECKYDAKNSRIDCSPPHAAAPAALYNDQKRH